MDAGSVTDSATVRASNPHGVVVVSLASGATVAGAATSSIGLAASSLSASYSTAGGVVAYRYVVMNTGQATLHGVAVSDARSSPTCLQSVLAPGASATCIGTYVVTQADVDAGSIASTATAAAGYPLRVSL